MVNTYQEAKEYLESFIRPTVFARIEADKHLASPLERMEYLLHLLGDPQHSYPSIQVSGTSGKGSTSYLISHILTTEGYTTGYTLSPHLQKITERIQVNNTPITDDEFVSLLNDVIPFINQMTNEEIGSPSYFEILLAMSLRYFAKKKIDILVAEVGLEGKHDGTNALHPLIAVLTNISLDHTRILGDTVEAIAEEATSIIKEKNMTVVTGVTQPSVKKILQQKAKRVDASVLWCHDEQITKQAITRNGSTFSLHSSQSNFVDLRLSLPGSYQWMNAVLAVETVAALSQKGFPVSDESVRQALMTAMFPGRFELVVKKEQKYLLDGAHNPAKMTAFLMDVKKLYEKEKKVFVIAFKEGKDLKEMIEQLIDQADSIILTEFSVTTDLNKNAATSVDALKEVILPYVKSNQLVFYYQFPSEALKRAEELALGKKLIVVTGSLYLVGETRSILGI